MTRCLTIRIRAFVGAAGCPMRYDVEKGCTEKSGVGISFLDRRD
jgi:hypothetical protein